ncbi:cytochrome C biogenesis protein [Bacillus sp. V3-13]|uniref:divalent cation tolerance protein CutA n=1 Tax=Bacillus sp. V3-13 TaxID=2053728 RepID=UPI000C76DF1B|nr:cytochrome C biogenesis protein [Bacillus sp. V3-13]PLR76605.1 cytochrome C biogenesis protein [Bacillus sp. V3-13]
MNFDYVKVEVLIPEEYIKKLRNELNEAGFLTVGLYDHVLSFSPVRGFWRPLEGAKPFAGSIGEISTGSECKVEFRCLFNQLKEVKAIIRSIHPYEHPIINAIPLL